MDLAAVLRSKGDDVITIAPDAVVSEAVDRLGERRIGALVVTDNGRVTGIFSERDVIYCLRQSGGQVLDWPVSRVMTAPVITAEPSTPVLSALALMTERRIRHLPVEHGAQLIGIVSIGDLVKHRMEQIESEAQAMRSYIQAV
ncbi:CBS domain-containing protein [Sphingomonas piscis]|uniref:CBS domain-containing protein n=1 Tax=Sphingomonas piscis TaxID=2714943 RepID=A0A6G7YQ05_9SPHN|nr:CBS domain-containing protein [Sphingomonas piscis]QIK78825.1 CBS domain-containing protein [Sphingomonas piscis]